MNKAILLPGLLSQQPYQNVRWKSIPLEWRRIYKNKFKVSLHDDYYSGYSFRSKIFRHIVYIYSYMKANKKTLIDYYAFSLSILACAIEEDVIKFENMVDIFIDLESKIFQARYAYKMCMIVTRDSCLPERYPFLKPCFVGNNSLICHILAADEYKLINLMKQLSTDYILNSVEYPFHSQACPLNSNSILLDNIEINLLTPIRNIFSICGQGIHDIMINIIVLQ